MWAVLLPDRRRVRNWLQLQAAYCLPGALLALALTLPMYRKLLLWHQGPEAIYYELRDGFAYLSDIPTLAAMAAWLVTPFWRRAWALPRWLTATLAALALLATLSALWAPMPATALYHATRLWVLLAVYLIIGTIPEARGALVWGILLAGALQAAIGIAQFVHQGSLGLLDLGEVPVRPEWSGASVLTVGGLRILRAYGLTQHPNVLGGVLAVTTVIGAATFLAARGRRAGVALVLAALSFAGLLFSFSRAAWLGLAVAGGVGAVLSLRRRPGARITQQAATSALDVRTPGLAPVTQQGTQQAATSALDVRTPGLAPVAQQETQQAATSALNSRTPGLAPVTQQGTQQAATSERTGGGRRLAALLSVLAAVGLLFVITQWPLLRPRLGLTAEGVEIRSVDERATLEAGAWTLIREHPWLGVGYASFAVALYERQPEAVAAYPIYQPVHKVPLLAAAELGIPGVLLWLALAVGPWAAIWARRRTWPPAGGSGWLAIGTAAALAALTVISWFDFYPWQSQPGRLLWWIMLALWAQSLAPEKLAG